MKTEYKNPNFKGHPRYEGKTRPPQGWVRAQTPIRHLMLTSIPVKQVLVDWFWRNRHAEPVFAYYIPDQPEYIFRDQCISDYYDRLAGFDNLARREASSRDAIGSAREQLPILCKERVKNSCGCSRRKNLNGMIRSAAKVLDLTVPMDQDKFHEFVKTHAC